MDDIARYGAYLTDERHASQNTVSSYLRDVTQFRDWLYANEDCELRQADSDMVQDYMRWMMNRTCRKRNCCGQMTIYGSAWAGTNGRVQ